MKTLVSTVNKQTQDNRIAIRNQIEAFCEETKDLKPSNRLLFLLYFKYGHTKTEIASLLKIHPANVARRLCKIIDMIQKRLEELQL